MIKEEILYYLALQSVDGIGPVNARKLIEHCGGPKQVLEESQKNLSLIKGIKPNILKQMKSRSIFKKAEREINFMEKHHISASHINEQTYPAKLKHCQDAPLVLFQKGSFDIRKKKLSVLLEQE